MAIHKTVSLGRCVGMLLLLLFLSDIAQAQWSGRWLAVGRLQSHYLGGGSEPESMAGIDGTGTYTWPGHLIGTYWGHWRGLWVSAKNWRSPDGQQFPVRIEHIGPRFNGVGEVFQDVIKLVYKFEAPEIIVDGLRTFDKPAIPDEIDATLKADAMVYNKTRNAMGVEMKRKVYQFSNEFHQDYHIIEYVFTNTGNVDEDEEVELPNQTLQDVYFTFFYRNKANAPAGAWDNSGGGAAWGGFTMNDALVPGFQEYEQSFAQRHAAQFSWLGHVPLQKVFNTIGNPMWFELQSWIAHIGGDTTGRLGAAAMFGTLTIHADQSAANRVHDPAQPRMMTYLESDDEDLTSRNDHNDLSVMQLERNWLEDGNRVANDPANARYNATNPTHAYLIQSDGRFDLQTADPSIGKPGGWGYVQSFGPYTLGPNDSIRIVVAEGIAGLSDKLSFALGKWYKNMVRTAGRSAADTALFSWNPTTDSPCSAAGESGCISLTKNQWVMTARDSLFQLFGRILQVWQNNLEIPQPPKPPRRFSVTSGTDQITLEWETYSGEPDPPGGWEIWRAQNFYFGIPLPDSSVVYQRIAQLPGNARSFVDENVTRGVNYYYYIQAVGEEVNDPTLGRQVRLKSNRYWTQTYQPAVLRRPPGRSLDEVRVVPNPYNLEADRGVRFPDVQDKIAFYGLPARATIRIYTELGELVKIIEHTDGSGDEFWDLTTSSRQVVASGIYFAVITDSDTGAQTTRTIVIIR